MLPGEAQSAVNFFLGCAGDNFLDWIATGATACDTQLAHHTTIRREFQALGNGVITELNVVLHTAGPTEKDRAPIGRLCRDQVDDLVVRKKEIQLERSRAATNERHIV